MNPIINKITDAIWQGVGIFIGWSLASSALGFLPVLVQKLSQ